MATALVLQAAGRRQNGRWRRGSVDIAQFCNTSAWRASLRKAGVVLDFGAPSIADHVVNELMSLDAAFQIADAIKWASNNKPDDGEAKAAFQKAWDAQAEHEQKGREIEAAFEQAYANYTGELRKERIRDNKAVVLHLPRYRLLAQALSVVADFDTPMKDFDPADLDPPGLARYFENDELQHALSKIQALIEWRNQFDAPHLLDDGDVA